MPLYTQDFTVVETVFRIASPVPFRLPPCVTPFITQKGGSADVTYTVHIGAPPESPAGYTQSWQWRQNDRIARIENGSASSVDLYFPPGLVPAFEKNLNWMLYIAPERALADRGVIILHASSVLYRGKAFVFTAPSGGGKSTHAAIWEQCLGADVINGDKTLISERDGAVTAWGSPMAGTSGIWRNLSAPVAAIVILEMAAEISARIISRREAFIFLYSEAVKSDDDPEYNKKLLGKIDSITQNTKMIRLSCLPDQSAAEYLLRFTDDTRLTEDS